MYRSEDTSVATVDQSGLVTAVSNGNVRITVYDNNDGNLQNSIDLVISGQDNNNNSSSNTNEPTSGNVNNQGGNNGTNDQVVEPTSFNINTSSKTINVTNGTPVEVPLTAELGDLVVDNVEWYITYKSLNLRVYNCDIITNETNNGEYTATLTSDGKGQVKLCAKAYRNGVLVGWSNVITISFEGTDSSEILGFDVSGGSKTAKVGVPLTLTNNGTVGASCYVEVHDYDKEKIFLNERNESNLGEVTYEAYPLVVGKTEVVFKATNENNSNDKAGYAVKINVPRLDVPEYDGSTPSVIQEFELLDSDNLNSSTISVGEYKSINLNVKSTTEPGYVLGAIQFSDNSLLSNLSTTSNVDSDVINGLQIKGAKAGELIITVVIYDTYSGKEFVNSYTLTITD